MSSFAETSSELLPPMEFNVRAIRADFPILETKVGNNPLVYLDSAATAQKPRRVIEALVEYYSTQNANIHRGIHFLSESATEAFEESRERAAKFIHASEASEIIFVRGTTEGISLVAHSFGRGFIREGDEIVLSILEHHSNIVPWQLEAEERGAVIKVIPMDDTGTLDLEAYAGLLNERTKIVALSHISNALGIVNPIAEMIETAHRRGIPVLIDGAQSAPHLRVDVEKLDCDFFVFSGHKLFGPTGIGVLYGKRKWLEEMPPYQSGGGAIRTVRFEKTIYQTPPGKFEAGTPHIGGAIGLAAAMDYVDGLGREQMEAYEKALYEYAVNTIGEIEGVRLFGNAPERVSVLSFLLKNIHAHDISTFLDAEGIAIRAGHHCAQPLMRRLGIPGTARASFSIYNTKAEIDKLAMGIDKILKFFN